MGSWNLYLETFLKRFWTERKENEVDILKGKEVGDFSAEKRKAKNQRKLLCLSNSFLVVGTG